MNHMLKRSVSFLLAVLMVLSLMPRLTLRADAAELSGLADDGIGLAYTEATNSGTVEWSANGTQITGTVMGKKNGPTYKVETSTLTLTNNKGTNAKLTFDYSFEQVKGTLTIGGTSYTGSGSFSCELADKETLQIALAVNNNGSQNKAVLTITNLSVVAERDTTTTFRKAENGTYTVTDAEGTEVEITEDTQLVQLSSKPYILKATAAEGYVFFGWYNETIGSYLSYKEQTTYQSDADQAIVPVFVSDTTAVFEVAGANFVDLNEAGAYAVSNGKSQITLIRSGSISGSYTIPAGVTLLIPFDDAQTCYTTTPANTGVVRDETGKVTGATPWEQPYPFRTLTMTDGSSITVNGALSVSAQHTAGNSAGGHVSYVGCPTGPVGFIRMAEGSQIIVNNGGAAYVWGYIIGDGTVTAKSGATVYENMQFTDFRGGSATLLLADPEGMGGELGVFPLSQYYVQNVEVKLMLEAGADEYVYTSLYMSGMALSSGVKFMGAGAMFVPESGGYITKEYLPDEDRLLIEVNGNAQINSLSLELGGTAVNSSDYTLPINSNITIKINSGKTVINQNMAMLPGSAMTVAQGAELNVAEGWSVYIYDADEWDSYIAINEEGEAILASGGTFVNQGLKFIPLPYSPTRTYERTVADLVDVKIDLNGKISANGYVYTTWGGADVHTSEGTGLVHMISGLDLMYVEIKELVGFGYTYQAIQEDINIIPAIIPTTSIRLVNADGTYTETEDAVAGDAYAWNTTLNKWAKIVELTVDFDPNGGSGEMAAITVTKDMIIAGNNMVIPPECEFTRTGYDFKGWATSADGEVVYAPGAVITLNTNVTLYAVWEPETYCVEFYAEDWSGALEATYGEKFEVPDESVFDPAPAKEGCYLAGWTTVENGTEAEYKPGELIDVTSDMTLYAVWQIHVYTVTWLDENGNIEGTEVVEYGKDAVNVPTVPEKEGYTGTWDQEAKNVTSDLTIKPVYTIYTYVVTWVDENGNTVATETVEYGKDAANVPAVPAKEGHSGVWEAEAKNVTSDLTIKPVYTINTYVVTWVDENGNTVATETVEHGKDAVNVPAVPEKEGHSCAWEAEAKNVTSDLTIKPVYTIHTFTVKFINEDGTLLQESTVPYGTVPAYTGEIPTKAADAQYEYFFAGWDKPLAAAKEDAVYTAVYSTELQTYTVTWVNADGTVLETDEEVPSGQMPSYDGAEPVKAADAQYTYTFAGWTPKVGIVAGDVTYTATYTATVNKYTVKFVDADGTVLEQLVVAYGEMPAYTGETPVKASTAEFTYTFAGWDKEIVAVTGDATYTATYTATVNKYTIKFVDEDGTLLQEIQVAYGEMPGYTGETPAKASTAEFTYTFAGWTPALAAVTGDATYTATYTATVNKYTVKFVNEDGTILEELQVEYGTVPAYSKAAPKKAATAQYTYTFAGWDKEIVAVTGDATYTATYTETVNKYTVKFVNEDGTVLQSSEVAYGEVPAYTGETPVKAATAQYTYTFSGWDKEIVTVTGEATYTATFEATVNKYTVKFVNEDGTVLQETQVAYGEMPAYTGATPTKAATAEYTYTFAGWDRELAAVTGNATYTATYTATVNEYTVKFVNEDGTVLQEGKVPYGTVPAYTGETPVKAETGRYTYTFAGWDKEIVAVTGDTTYTATYTANDKLTVQWISITTTLSGDIGLNFYTRLSEELLNDPTAFIRFTFAGRTLDVPVYEAVVVVKNGQNQYRFTCPITSKNMTDEVTAQFMNAEGTIGTPKTMAVDTYCNWIIENYKGNELANLMKGMLNYGAAAQKLFNYRTDDLANAALSEEDKFLPEVDASAYAHVNAGSEEGIKVSSMTLLLDSETTARVYFELTGGKSIDEFTFMVNGKEVEPTYKNGKYYVEIRNIGAHRLHQMHTVTCGGITVKYAALSYVNQVMNFAAATPETVEMAKALYAYYLAAADYLS